MSIQELHAATLTVPPDALRLTVEDDPCAAKPSKSSGSKPSSAALSGQPPSIPSMWPYPTTFSAAMSHMYPTPNMGGNMPTVMSVLPKRNRL